MNKSIYLLVITTFFMIASCSGSDDQTQKGRDSGMPAVAKNLETHTIPSKPLTLEQRGALHFRRCKSCHTIEKGGRNRVGPNLYDIIGKHAGQTDDFAYSRVMRESGIVWTEDILSSYLENPRKFLPGNTMSFAGLRKPDDREALIAYLKHEFLSDNEKE